jgi:hypothetical protein
MPAHPAKTRRRRGNRPPFGFDRPLANIASRLGRAWNWDPVRETFDDPLANRLRSRATRQPWA